ncbi:MAG TPA: gephyrin-like molybdotransferase Glp [Solirubrobacterales bacterium]|nr:gephyrin-like molybdotransferase Glp [Solirubrobacterales bacterium]
MGASGLSPEAARELILAAVVPTPAEPVPLEECLGRVTADAVTSGLDLQPFDNSAMDGYALRAADTADPGPLRLIGESRAGLPARDAVGPGEAAWISTGAMIPAGADAVLAVEEAREQDGAVLPSRQVVPGEHIRRAGEDLKAGATLLARGQAIGAAQLAVLAATGNASVSCARCPTVAILGSGDELVSPGASLGPGQIYDSNSFALTAQAREAGAVLDYATALPDDPDAIREVLDGALGRDLLVVAGGISVGRHDHVKDALAKLGVRERFWRVAMRPGGPTWFGVQFPASGGRPTLVFGLPGNPVSAMVTFHLFVRPALRALVGLPPLSATTCATLAEPYLKKPGKAHYARCRLELTAAGWRAHLTHSNQGSHILTSMLGADALAAVPADRQELAAGELVEVELLRWSGAIGRLLA